MKKAPFLVGVAIGLAAIVLAWSRNGDTGSVGVQASEPASPPTQPSHAATGAASADDGRPRPHGASGEQALSRESSAIETLQARELLIPVEGVSPSELRDDFDDPRAGYAHEALDVLAPRGTRVIAADDGFVAKLFTSTRGGLTVYQFDLTQTWCFYYAHLDRYAPELREGQSLRRGDLLGFVGTTGNAPPRTPHLHFAIFRLGAEKRWWQGAAVNPYPLLTRRSIVEDDGRGGG